MNLVGNVKLKKNNQQPHRDFKLDMHKTLHANNQPCPKVLIATSQVYNNCSLISLLYGPAV